MVDRHRVIIDFDDSLRLVAVYAVADTDEQAKRVEKRVREALCRPDATESSTGD